MLATQGHGSRLSWRAAIAVAALFLVLMLVYQRLTSEFVVADPSRGTGLLNQIAFQTATKTSRPWIDFYFQKLHNPSVLPDTPRYSLFGAKEWHLPEDIAWHARAGKDLCIIDFDNRAFDAPGQIFGPNVMSWQDADSIHGLSLGILNHWLYSKIHGYKYYYVVVDEYKDRRTSWKKPALIAKLLEKHQACIYLDSDAVFRNLDLPFEWLMNYWQLGPASNSLALAFDPKAKINQDEFGLEYLNTGFLVAQNNSKTYEVLAAWEDCPNEGGRYPECTKFRKNNPGRPTDQGGFGTYVRYDYADDIRDLPCDEANGFAEAHADCDGTFVRHVWTGKDSMLKVFVGEQMPGPYVEYFHEEFLATKAEFLLNENELMG